MKRIAPVLLAFAVAVSSFVLTKFSAERGEARRPVGREDRTGAMAALDFWTEARAYPDKDIPKAKYYQAFEREKALALKNNRRRPDDLAAVWTPLGPMNLQGRMLSVAVNPQNGNCVYVGSASGGLWRSYSGGTKGDWQQILTGFPVRGVGAIAINPLDTGTIYIGSGEVYRYQGSFGGQVVRTTRGSYGIGILKSTNAGSSWSLSLNWSLNQQSGIQKIVLNPQNPNTVYAGTSEGLYKSTDAGGTWTNILSVVLAEDVLVNPLDTNLVLVSCGNLTSPGAGVYRSTNGGTNWVPTVVPLPVYRGKTLLTMYGANPYRVYASVGIDSVTDHGALYTSTDFGDTWSLVFDHLNNSLFQVQGWYSHYVAVHPADSNQIVQAGVPIYKSFDNGQSFNNTTGYYSDNHGFAIDPSNPNIIYSACDDGIYRSTDFGTGWTNVGYGLVTGQFYNGFSSSWQDSLLAVGQSQDHIPGYRFLGAASWDHTSVSDESGWTGIDPTNDYYVYAVNRFGGAFYRWGNRGATYLGGIGFDGTGAWNSPFVIAPSNPTVLYFGDIHVHKSTNRGAAWSLTAGGAALDGNPALSMAIGMTSQDTVYVGTAPIATTAHLYRTINGGTSWSDVTGSTPNRYPMDLAVDPHDSKTVYAAFGGFGTGHLFKTADAGATWFDISGTLPDVPTTAVAIDPANPGNVYVGNDLGVYVSTDAGGSWTAFNDGLPDAVIIADLSISPSNRSLRAVTHGNGVYERKLFGDFPANYFDYKPLSFISPAAGEYDTIGSHIVPSVMFRSLSTQAHADPFSVKYRILDGATEVYSAIQTIPGLGIGENRLVSFGTPFSPTGEAHLSVQAIVMAGDMDPSNDTLTGSIDIVLTSDVATFAIEKDYCPYVDLVGGTPGPAGDDAVLAAALPFQFKYDGHLYDSVQISTNGWMEFGAGSRGSLFGLSTPGQLTGYFVASLPTTARPTKAIGPWWADLLATSGQITFGTLGSAPNRTFVIQWKNVLANYDPGYTTATLNFQVRLSEANNLLDISYGPMIPGSTPGVTASAAMGFKDYIGGDYRFYDLFNRGTGSSGFLNSSLNPRYNWPGPDSCFHVQSNPQGISVALSAGWNMVSNPLSRPSNAVSSVYPAAGSKAFRYSGGYLITDSLIPGAGYWINVPSSSTPLVQGSPLASMTQSVAKGWNMIGSVDHSVPVPSGGVLTGNVFGYAVGGYTVATTIDPGRGYWVRASADGSINLGPANSPKRDAFDIAALSSMTISDRLGNVQTLYLSEEGRVPARPDDYVLPPSPPEGAFDVRFASSTMLETWPALLQNDRIFRLTVNGAVFPLKVTFSIKNEDGRPLFLEEVRGGSVVASHALKGEGSVQVTEGADKTLALRVAAARTVPVAYALHQNYPNPFNPSTSITFDIPARSFVTLKVYDLLGREVMTPAQGEFEAGSYTVRTDFGGVASGIYLCRFTAGTFTETKKMVVTR